MPDRPAVDVGGAAAPGRGADRGHVRRADSGGRISWACRGSQVSLALAAAAVALLGLITACGSAAGQPPDRIPPRASLFRAIPAACSLVDASTASLLGLNPKGQQQPTSREGGVTEETCSWVSESGGSPGRPSSASSPSPFTLLAIVDLVTAATGQAPAAAAQADFQQEVTTNTQADGSRASPVAGLADRAFIEHVTRATLSESLVEIQDQNVVLTVTYGGSPGTAPAAINSEALTAARALLAALGAS